MVRLGAKYLSKNDQENRKGGFLCFQVTPGIPGHCLPATQSPWVKGKGGELTDTCLRLLENTRPPHSWPSKHSPLKPKHQTKKIYLSIYLFNTDDISVCCFGRSKETKAPLNQPWERKQSRQSVHQSRACETLVTTVNSIQDSPIKGLFKLNIQHRRQLTNTLMWSTWALHQTWWGTWLGSMCSTQLITLSDRNHWKTVIIPVGSSRVSVRR